MTLSYCKNKKLYNFILFFLIFINLITIIISRLSTYKKLTDFALIFKWFDIFCLVSIIMYYHFYVGNNSTGCYISKNHQFLLNLELIFSLFMFIYFIPFGYRLKNSAPLGERNDAKNTVDTKVESSTKVVTSEVIKDDSEKIDTSNDGIVNPPREEDIGKNVLPDMCLAQIQINSAPWREDSKQINFETIHDLNNDQRVSVNEYETVTKSCTRLAPSTIEKMSKLLDSSGNNFITQEEFDKNSYKLLREFNEKPTKTLRDFPS